MKYTIFDAFLQQEHRLEFIGYCYSKAMASIYHHLKSVKSAVLLLLCLPLLTGCFGVWGYMGRYVLKVPAKPHDSVNIVSYEYIGLEGLRHPRAEKRP